MRCTICCAVFGLLVSSEAAFPQAHAAPRPWARPHVRVVSVRWFAPNPAIFLPYCSPVSFPYPVPYPVPDPVPYPVWNFVSPSPAYVFVGSASPSHPQLVFKEGTNRTGGGIDLDEFVAYMTANSPVTGPVPNRATPTA